MYQPPGTPIPTLFLPSRGTGVGENLVKAELGTQPHWAPVQGTSTSTGSQGGATYLIETRQVTQMSYAALYKDLALLAVTIYSYVHMSPQHIFLHQIYRNAMRTISTPDQFTHMLPSTVYCITTPRYYFQGTKCIITDSKYNGKKLSCYKNHIYIVNACGSNVKNNCDNYK